MEFGLPMGTLIYCISLILIMFNQWYSGIYWFVVGIFIIIIRFYEFSLFKKHNEF